jgi:hypothetical protein
VNVLLEVGVAVTAIVTVRVIVGVVVGGNEPVGD